MDAAKMVESHDCDDPNVKWDDGYELGGLGEMLERTGFCRTCKKHVREIWIHSCELVDG